MKVMVTFSSCCNCMLMTVIPPMESSHEFNFLVTSFPGWQKCKLAKSRSCCVRRCSQCCVHSMAVITRSMVDQGASGEIREVATFQDATQKLKPCTTPSLGVL